MKKSILAIMALFTALVAGAGVSGVNILSGPTAVTNGIPELVTAQVTASSGTEFTATLEFCYCQTNSADHGWTEWSTTNSREMSLVSGSTYQAYIPSMGSGWVKYRVKAVAGDEDPVFSNESGEITVYEWPEDPIRFADFSGTWTKVNQSWGTPVVSFDSNYCHVVTGKNGVQQQWRVSGSAGLTPAAQSAFKVPGGSASSIGLNNYGIDLPKPFLLSPYYEDGVGTIYYSAKMHKPAADGTIEIQVTTSTEMDTEKIDDKDWETVGTVYFERRPSEPLDVHAAPITLNRQDIKRVRIVRTLGNQFSTDKATGLILIDNFVVSAPPTDIELVEHLRNPGYPANDQEIKMRVSYLDVIPAAPARNVKMTLYYQHLTFATDIPKPGSWLTIPMLPKDNGIYEGVVPPQEAGYMAYYYRADFDGNNYGRDPDGDPDINYGDQKTVVMGGTEPFFNESLSANYFTYGTTWPELPTYYSVVEIRPFHSNYSRVAIESEDTPGICVSNLTLVADNEWQYAVKIDNTMTNFTWNFVGYDEYVDEATAFNSDPVVWGDTEQSFTAPPLAGKLVVDPERQAAMQAEFEYDGFVLFRANVNNPANMDYIVKRAVYQNFDDWDAAEEYYEESLGLYATQRFENDLDAWPLDHYSPDEEVGDDLQNERVDAELVKFPALTSPGWERTFSQVCDDGANGENKALFLAHGGTVENTWHTIRHGVEYFSFKGRISMNDDHYALYKNGVDWSLQPNEELVLSSTLSADIPTDTTNAYVSIIFMYNDSLGGDYPSYYEARLRNAKSGQQSILCTVWRHDAGKAEPTKIQNEQGFGKTKLAVSKAYSITVKHVNDTKVTITIGCEGSTKTWTDGSAQSLKSGTIGFNGVECIPEISKVEVSLANVSKNPAAFASDNANWYMGGKRSDDPSADRWIMANAGNGMALTRAIPTETLEVWSCPRIVGTETGNADRYRQYIGDITVDSLKYTDIVVPFKGWGETYIQLRHAAGDTGVVVDDLYVQPWRAKTHDSSGENAYNRVTEDDNSYYFDWTSVDDQNKWLGEHKDWAVLEGWTTEYNGGAAIEFDATRRNPDLVQAVVSPLLTNGIGSISFTYNVVAGVTTNVTGNTTELTTNDVVYVVERTADGYPNTWEPITVYTNRCGESGKRFCKIAAGFEGRIRVRLVSDASTGAVIILDNFLAKDYPPRDETSWYAFNCKITGTDNTEGRLYNNIGRTCYLNNSPDAGTHNEDYSISEPYIQTPIVGTGIGEISFYYRAYTLNHDRPARLIIKSAPSADTPEDQWTTITNMSVFTTGDERQFVKFYNPSIYQLKNKVVRFYSPTNGVDRFCIDEILVTEPVRAGYEIYKVELDPVQPLSYTNVNLRVEIGRFIMDPENIQVYCSYHVGADNWGYTNWWVRGTSDNCKRIELKRVDENSKVFTTTETVNIPAQPADEVVQFVVWGVHKDIPLLSNDVIFQGTNTFVNPEWYAPVDLNAENEESGWSPYYFSYSCPPKSVRFNEVNYYENDNDLAWADLAELVGPCGADISGWRFDIVDDNENVLWALDVANDTKLDNTHNGYGFYAWGDFPVDTAAPGKLDVVPLNDVSVDVWKDLVYADGYGCGFRLYRPNGQLEEAICFSTAASKLKERGYTYIGAKAGGGSGSLGLTLPRNYEGTVTNLDSLVWGQVANYTPHAPNYGETLTPIEPIPGGDEPAKKFKLTSLITGGEGTQDGGTQMITVELPAGSSTSIVYRASEWSRIKSLKSNDGSVAPATDAKEYTFAVQSISEDISNEVEFGEAASPVQGVPVKWLATKGTEAEIDNAIENGDGDDLAVYEEYLLNTDPTVETNVKFGISSIKVDDENVSLDVSLERTEGEGPSMKTITEPINGRLTIYSSDDLTMFDDTTVEPVVVPASDGNFFKAKIEGKAE